MNILRKRLIAAATGLALATTSAAALAVTSGAPVGPLTQVEYGFDGVMLIQSVSGVQSNYYTPLTAPCTGILAATPDIIKGWLSVGQSALLSGKSVRIYWSKCTSSGTMYIQGIDLLPN